MPTAEEWQGMGLPGRFVFLIQIRPCGICENEFVSGDSELESVSQFFHVLGSVDQQRGCCKLGRRSMRLPYIPPAVIQIREFTITIPMKIIRSAVLICIKKIWTQRNFAHIH